LKDEWELQTAFLKPMGVTDGFLKPPKECTQIFQEALGKQFVAPIQL
jgi:hypothetical protein